MTRLYFYKPTKREARLMKLRKALTLEKRKFLVANRLVVKRKEPKVLTKLKGNLRRFDRRLNTSKKEFNKSTKNINSFLGGY